jgi:hypothetical protein
MRRPTLPRLALIITSFPAIASAQEPPDSPDVDTAFRAVVQKYVDAREARDPKAIEPLFTADADQLVSDGTARVSPRSRLRASSQPRTRRVNMSIRTTR